ncbi:arginine--tRNA ligase [Spirochaetia bacterium]|nr:arginine--tRNA ligase [Spirochaetia bacterium]
MYDYKKLWKLRIARALSRVMKDAGIEGIIDPAQVVAEIPPQPELGDLGFPMFSFAKLLRKGPPQIAQAVAAALSAEDDGGAQAAGGNGIDAGGSFAAQGPYLNVRLNRGEAAAAILAEALAPGVLMAAGEAENRPAAGLPPSGDTFAFGRPGTLTGSRIMVEFSSPNTNKPLHLGHLRNDVLGESVSRILAACGAEVCKVCIINDRGVHICKSMLAYQEEGGGKTPESENLKGDHFVGNWYVRFNKVFTEEVKALEKEKGLTKEEAEAQAPALAKAQDLLRKWEAGDAATVELWKKMNAWAVGGMKETWERTGISFDQFYFESQTYLLGKDEVLKGLEKGLFYKKSDGAVAVDLSAEKLDEKVLLRKDGTSIYITQDIGTAIFRHKDWPFDRLVFVVGSEQQYHFKVLFTILDKLGFEWAKNLYHLSYGMVNLPEGKMKSREGTVVDADDLIDSLRDMALNEIREKDREAAVGDSAAVAEKIALGALHYYLLQVSPTKDMLFDPKESLSFNGNTGPYLQYMGARISALLSKASMLRKAGETAGGADAGGAVEGGAAGSGYNAALLTGDAEWELIKTLAGYPEAVSAAAAGMDPSLLAAYLYELSKTFSRFYHDCPILNADDPGLAAARLALSRAVLRVLQDALELICIPFLEAM